MPNVTLLVDDTEHFGWTGMSVRRSLSSLCGSFELSLSPNWDTIPLGWKAKPGQKCTLKLENTPLLVGFIEQISEGISENERAIRVSGRDITCDLVDSHPVGLKRVWQSPSVKSLAEYLSSPFQIKIREEAIGKGPLRVFSIQDETIYSALERAAKLRQLILYTDETGALVISRPAVIKQNQGVLVEGSHVLSAERTTNTSNRFAEYRMYVMNTGALDGNEENLKVFSEAKDREIARKRVMQFSPEGYAQAQNGKLRLEWEKTVRQAKSEKITVNIPHWFNADQKPWKLNRLVTLEIPSLSVSGDYLVSGVSFYLDSESGPKATLECESPKVYSVDPTLFIQENTKRDFIAKESN